jgi:hypothetical protein
MKCGGSTKMAKGGTVSKPFAAGIPYASGAGATDGKNGMMKKGGAVKKALPKAQDGKTVKKVGPNKYAKDQVIVNKKDGSSASYVATNKGTVYSTKNKKNGPADVLSIDTTGYSKGKPNYDQIYTGNAGYNKSTVKRKDVKPLLKSMKKETLSFKTGGITKGGVSGEELRNRGIDMKYNGIDLKDAGTYQKELGREMKAVGKGSKARGMAMKEKGKALKQEALDKLRPRKVTQNLMINPDKRSMSATGPKPMMAKKGGAVKNAKLAALAAPKNKITRADVIVGAKRNAKKK